MAWNLRVDPYSYGIVATTLMQSFIIIDFKQIRSEIGWRFITIILDKNSTFASVCHPSRGAARNYDSVLSNFKVPLLFLEPFEHLDFLKFWYFDTFARSCSLKLSNFLLGKSLHKKSPFFQFHDFVFLMKRRSCMQSFIILGQGDLETNLGSRFITIILNKKSTFASVCNPTRDVVGEFDSVLSNFRLTTSLQ